MEKLGTIIHGIGATEHLDSSGERIEVKGIDISSLTVDGLVNFEHKSEAPSQLIGKIIEAEKILTKADCKNKHHEYFWEKAGKTPYLYIKAVLFDKFNHAGAMDAVAMLQFDKASSDSKNSDIRQVSGFSIEGSRLDKEGSLIKKCIARKMSFTAYPCNKACIAEILEPAKNDSNKMISLADLKEAFKKAEESEMDLNKTEEKTGIIPKRVFSSESKEIRNKLRVGDRITYPKPKKVPRKTGEMIYKDPNTWKNEVDCMSNARKAILNKVKKSNSTANVKTQMMLNEDMDKSNSTANVKTQMMQSEKSMKRKEVLKSMSQEAFDLFPHKEELLSSIRKTMPEASENEVMAFAKTYAYVSLKKQEIALADLVKDSSLNEED